MSEFAEGFTVSKLIGAPAGYVGYRESAKLTDGVKQRPYSVVLFDEIEKAHRDVQNLLLQILEEGELTDATGRKVNFKNTIIILTSNVGLEQFERGSIGFAGSDGDRQITLDGNIRRELEERFRPELLNRLDHTCIFQPLSDVSLVAIAEKQLAELASRLKERGTDLRFDEKIAGHIAKRAQTKFGARDIRRHIESEIEHRLAERLLSPHRPSRLAVTVKGKQIIVTQPR
jgi:ATP-dependent Clp protease ATP-binding subunit ClpC